MEASRVACSTAALGCLDVSMLLMVPSCPDQEAASWGLDPGNCRKAGKLDASGSYLACKLALAFSPRQLQPTQKCSVGKVKAHCACHVAHQAQQLRPLLAFALAQWSKKLNTGRRPQSSFVLSLRKSWRTL